MALLTFQLDLERCPHCQVDRPTLAHLHSAETTNHQGTHTRAWRIYECARCGGVVTAAGPQFNGVVREVYPSSPTIDEAVPTKAKSYLEQALNSLHAPAGAIMLAASAIDAMLKAKGLKDGSLYQRIDQAAANHLITVDMATWAHEVRLDANDERHADDDAPLPTEPDARRCVDFALALAQFLYVLPARVARGITAAQS